MGNDDDTKYLDRAYISQILDDLLEFRRYVARRPPKCPTCGLKKERLPTEPPTFHCPRCGKEDKKKA